MAVKKSIYIGLTDQDIEDMEMYFSNKFLTTHPR